MKWILFFAVLFLSIIGLSELLHSFKMLILRPKIKNGIHVCFLKDNDAELNLIYAAEQMRWYGKTFANKIIAVDLTDKSDKSQNYDCIAKKHNVEIIKPVEFNILNYGDMNGTNYNKGNS